MQDERTDGVILGSLAIDYVTMVSSDVQRAKDLFKAITWNLPHPMIGDPNRYEHPYASVGPVSIAPIPRQKKENGRLVYVSGRAAHTYAAHLGDLQDVGHCSRIDLQVTIPTIEGFDMERLYHVLGNPDKFPWKQSGKAPFVQLFRNTEGGETLYIGKRTSDLMTRIYRKCIEGIWHLRWEVELKGRLARGLVEQGGLTDHGARCTVARAILAGYPDTVQHSLLPFAEAIDAPTGELLRPRPQEDDEAHLLWFRRTVVPALTKAMRGKYSAEVAAMLAEQNIALTSHEHLAILKRDAMRYRAELDQKFENLQERTRTR